MSDATILSAHFPLGRGGGSYHLETHPGDFAPRCILVGSPSRADEIGDMLTDSITFENARELRAYTGFYKGVRVTVCTTGMGGPSFAIALKEAVDAGARAFIRVGSCSALRREIPVGGLVIVRAAIRFDGPSNDWAMPEFPAASHYRVVAALEDAAIAAKASYCVGIEATTADFNEGQGRAVEGFLSESLRRRHEWVMHLAHCYSMEAATGCVWCDTHGGLPFAAVNAVFGNRATDAFQKGAGETLACQVGLDAICALDMGSLLASLPSHLRLR